MSKRSKRLQRFLANPPVKDFRWEEFVSLMGQLGFDLKEQKGGSSHCHFVLRSNPDRVIDTSRPHPSGILKSYQIREVSSKIKEWELI